MVGPNTRPRRFWSEDEDKNLIIGLNRFYESSTMYRDIEKDVSLDFDGNRRNTEIKDRIRLYFDDLEPYHSFLVPINATNKLFFIPEEYVNVITNPVAETPITVLPIAQRERFSRICFLFVTTVTRFKEEIELLPDSLSEDPVKEVITWDQLCRKSFKGRNKLSSRKKADLLVNLVKNGYLLNKKVGIRTYVCRNTNSFT